MAEKKAAPKRAPRKKEPVLFYADKHKYLRVKRELGKDAKPAALKKAYLAHGGKLQEGYGYLRV